MSKEYVKGDQQQARSYSKIVKTQGGTTLYLAGVGGSHDDDGNLLDFAGQTRRAFTRLTENLEAAGGTLADMVTMTVFVTDVRFGDQFTQIRKEFFEDNYPGSALIAVVGLGHHAQADGLDRPPRDAPRDPRHRRHRLATTCCTGMRRLAILTQPWVSPSRERTRRRTR